MMCGALLLRPGVSLKEMTSSPSKVITLVIICPNNMGPCNKPEVGGTSNKNIPKIKINASIKSKSINNTIPGAIDVHFTHFI